MKKKTKEFLGGMDCFVRRGGGGGGGGGGQDGVEI